MRKSREGILFSDFSYLLASVIEIWQDVTVLKYAEIIESQSCIYGSASENQEDSIYAFAFGIARNYIEVGIHKVNLSIFKTILLGFFAGMFIGFAGIASTTSSSTIGIASVAKLVGAAVFRQVWLWYL